MGTLKDLSPYSEELNRFIRFLDGAKKKYEDCKIELNRQEQLKIDLLHLLELKCNSAKDRTRISKKLQKCLLWRRECKDTIALLEPLVHFMNSDKGKFVINQLPQILGSMRKEEKHIAHRGYAPRIMTYEEFENALAPEEPNAVTYAAMEEAEQTDTSGKSYVRVNDLVSALEK